MICGKKLHTFIFVFLLSLVLPAESVEARAGLVEPIIAEPAPMLAEPPVLTDTQRALLEEALKGTHRSVPIPRAPGADGVAPTSPPSQLAQQVPLAPVGAAANASVDALAARDYSRVVVFGDSLSDPGNAFVFTGMALTPPYTSPIPGLLIPDYPYARGGHHLSNGSTWIEQLATRMKLGNSVGPALRVPGKFSNYAIDRTRACSNPDPAIPFPSHIDLTTQVQDLFLDQFEETAPSDALYVVFVGSNDVRDALALLQIGDQASAQTAIACALKSITGNLNALIGAGGRTFLIANIPNLGLIPAIAIQGPVVQAGATKVTESFNAKLGSILIGLEQFWAQQATQISFVRLDTFTLITNLIEQAPMQNPNLNVTDSCIDTLTGKVCAPAKNNLFWDSIHPTKTGHAFLAEEAAINLGLN